MENSQIIKIGQGSPTIGIVGLCHGDEICGRHVLDELKETLPADRTKGTILLVYANLPAEEAGERFVEDNLNRVFRKDPADSLEAGIADQLKHVLARCDLALDIHSTSYPSTPFAISTAEDEQFDLMAAQTGLSKYVLIGHELAEAGSLIDFVYDSGGRGVSFEAGTHEDESSVTVAREVARNFLAANGFICGEHRLSEPQKFVGIEVIKKPSETFEAYDIENFALLPAGTPYGKDETGEHSLDYDCHPFLFSKKCVDNMVFMAGLKHREGLEELYRPVAEPRRSENES